MLKIFISSRDAAGRQTDDEFDHPQWSCLQWYLSICNSLAKNRYKSMLYQLRFLSGFSFTDTDDSQGSRGREGTIFYSTLPLPPAHEHSHIYLQLCIWDEYHVFLIAPIAFTRLLPDDIYHLTGLPFNWLMMLMLSLVCLLVQLILGCYRNLTRETGGLELASAITLVLQANRLTKCASPCCTYFAKSYNWLF